MKNVTKEEEVNIETWKESKQLPFKPCSIQRSFHYNLRSSCRNNYEINVIDSKSAVEEIRVIRKDCIRTL